MKVLICRAVDGGSEHSLVRAIWQSASARRWFLAGRIVLLQELLGIDRSTKEEPAGYDETQLNDQAEQLPRLSFITACKRDSCNVFWTLIKHFQPDIFPLISVYQAADGGILISFVDEINCAMIHFRASGRGFQKWQAARDYGRTPISLRSMMINTRIGTLYYLRMAEYCVTIASIGSTNSHL